MMKALALLSGGLDSTLAIRVVLTQASRLRRSVLSRQQFGNPANTEKLIVVIFPDTSERYLSTELFGGIDL
jgi:cysteine synthase